MSKDTSNVLDKKDENFVLNWIKRHREVAFFSLVAGMSVMSGFATTLMLAKRRDSEMFDKGLARIPGSRETGGSLALRALGRGSLYAFGGFSVFCFALWKLSGANSVHELGATIQSAVRTVTPRQPDARPRGRSEFATVRELVNYLIDEDARAKSSSGKDS